MQKQTSISNFKYKKAFIPIDIWNSKKTEFFDRVNKIRSRWVVKSISDSEASGLYLICGLSLFFSKHWINGPSRGQPSSQDQILDAIKVFEWVPWETQYEKWFGRDLSLKTLFSQYSLKGVRGSALRVLSQWLSDGTPLVAFEKIPAAEEVLNLQKLGQRCVSLIFDESAAQYAFAEGRDPISFLLHDLGHAAQFFNNEETVRSQRFISHWLGNASVSGLIHEPSDEGGLWGAKLSYLISDLNTHPEHFKCVLWATARDSFGAKGRSEDFAGWKTQMEVVYNQLQKEFQL